MSIFSIALQARAIGEANIDFLICIQNRDKCASRDHLHLTVEEMRIFNARRKLKSLIVATANSIKWGHPSLDPNCDAFSDIDEDESISNRKFYTLQQTPCRLHLVFL